MPSCCGNPSRTVKSRRNPNIVGQNDPGLNPCERRCMHLPSAIEFTDGNARYANEGLYLHGYESVALEVRQSNIPELEYAGRLFVDAQLVGVRSADEAAVLALLATATFTDELPTEKNVHVGNITGVAGLMRLRDRFVEYVQSDAYLQIAKNGVKKPFRPW